MIDVRPLDNTFDRWDELLALILNSFSYMDGLIDPPSSAKRLDAAALQQKARTERSFIANDGEALLGCMFCKPEPGSLYIGKFAVAPSAQRRGIGRMLLREAEATAGVLGLTQLRLETRIELVGNHERFASWGFVRTAERSHPGYAKITFVEMRKNI